MNTEPVIALVVAMGENRAIGKGGSLPWHLRSDMHYFRKITMGKPVLMGRRTFKSLPRVLDGRLNVVLTRDRGFVAADAVMAYSLEEGLAAARASAARTGAGEIMVIGGEDVFREVLPQIDRIYLTEVHAAPEADTWFPKLDPNAWREVSRQRHEAGPKDDHACSFVILERVS
ncbi:MAG: dihydrofolate reductase [Methyloceanibacter sp.]